MSIRVMSMVYSAHFHDVSYLHKGKKKTGEEYEKTINVLNSNIKAVCLALADHANDEGEGAYPSVDTIGEKTELSEVTVIACLKAMRQEEIIEYAGRSKWSTCNYTISKQKLAEMATWERQKRAKPGTKAALVSKVKPLQPGTKAALPKPPLHPKTSNEEGAKPKKNLFAIYQEEIGVLTPMIADALKDAETTYQDGWLEAAIHEAAKNNKRNWKYCEAILKRWQEQGFRDDGKKPETKAKTKINSGKAALEKYAQELGLEV